MNGKGSRDRTADKASYDKCPLWDNIKKPKAQNDTSVKTAEKMAQNENKIKYYPCNSLPA